MFHIHNTRSREYLHREHAHNTVSWSKDLSNLKEVVYETPSHMNSSLLSALSFTKHFKETHDS